VLSGIEIKYKEAEQQAQLLAQQHAKAKASMEALVVASTAMRGENSELLMDLQKVRESLGARDQQVASLQLRQSEAEAKLAQSDDMIIKLQQARAEIAKNYKMEAQDMQTENSRLSTQNQALTAQLLLQSHVQTHTAKSDREVRLAKERTELRDENVRLKKELAKLNLTMKKRAAKQKVLLETAKQWRARAEQQAILLAAKPAHDSSTR